MDRKRNTAFDCARALSMLWIVGIYHMRGYTPYQLTRQASILIETFVTVSLGTFTFLSAYFLSKKAIQTKNDFLLFYRRRLLRIYPLFLLSCISLYAVSIIAGGYFESWKQLLLTLTGLTCFFSPLPLTVWYVSMLLFFYFLTPFVLLLKNRADRKWLAYVLVFGILAVLLILNQVGTLTIDDRFFEYYLVYFPTLLFVDKLIRSKKQLFLIHIAASVIVLANLIPAVYTFFNRSFLTKAIVASAGAAMVVWLCRLLDRVKLLSTILQWISYASMVAYLFHRQFFGLLEKLYGEFSIWFAAISLSVLLIVSYFVQKIYDSLMKKLGA